ncbi:MAG: zinc ribbon domain-containing protein [Lachnospiraceae bacterium]|nr:zinc ribbon domain-containing protein [Lachnospiraceae bacterium]
MYECPNCASNLKFDIARQSMFCDACGTVMSPYDVTKEADAEEREDFEVTVFTCPQCGAQIVSEDNEAAAFCSFCGGSTILDSRISKEKRPEYILPFKRTKDDCLSSFKKMTKRAIFSPDEVKDYKDIDSFRGIYMPYWMYTAVKQGHVCYDVRKNISKYRGDYEYIDHFNFDTDVDVDYTGVTYDASSSFSDSLSQAIEPFDTNQVEKFTPSFLSGFYADTLDVDGDVYDKQVEELTTQAVFDKLNSDAVMKGHSTTFDKAKKQLGTSVTKRTLVMLPVWFMSLRHKENGKEDRVAYVAVNGQTGEACADLPIDIKKYMIGALIATAAFFALFMLLPTMKPLILTIISGVIAIISGIIYLSQNSAIEAREKGDDDKGVQFARKKGILKAIPKFDTITGKKLKYEDPDSKINILGIKFNPASTAIVGSIIIAVGLFLIKPVSDIPYYVGTMIILVLVFMLLCKLMKRYNRLVTQPLPQFNRKGSDDSAKNAIRDYEKKAAETGSANASANNGTNNNGNGGGNNAI